MKSDFVSATSSLLGTILGAGIFGVPFVFAAVGFWVGSLMLALLAIVMVFIHLMYAEVVERTEGRHRLIGYSNIYFGDRVRNIISISVIVSIFGSLVIYILLANEFLGILFGSHLNPLPFFWGLIFWALVSAGVIKGIKTIAKVEFIMVVVLLITLAAIFFRGIPVLNTANLSGFDISNIFLPFGVILFSLGGATAIPEIHSFIKKDGKVFKKSIITGTLGAAFVIFVFAFIVVGVSGINTSEDAVSGLLSYLGPIVTYLGAIFGILTISTSYLVISSNIKDSLMYDWHIPKIVSTVAVLGFPLFIIGLGVRDLIGSMAFLGAILGAINGTMIMLLFVQAKRKGTLKPHINLKIPKPVLIALMLLLVLGGIYGIINIGI